MNNRILTSIDQVDLGYLDQVYYLGDLNSAERIGNHIDKIFMPWDENYYYQEPQRFSMIDFYEDGTHAITNNLKLKKCVTEFLYSKNAYGQNDTVIGHKCALTDSSGNTWYIISKEGKQGVYVNVYANGIEIISDDKVIRTLVLV